MELIELIKEKTDYLFLSKKFRKPLIDLFDEEIEIVERRNYKDQFTIDFFTLLWAIRRNKMHIFNWLWENHSKLFSDNLLNVSAKYGRFEMVVFLKEHGFNINERGINWACEGGYLEIIEYLHPFFPEAFTPLGLIEAARHGKLKIVQWFDKHYPQFFTDKIMDIAAENGHLEVIKWLHHNRSEGCTTGAIDSAALYGHIETIKWLLENRTEGWSDWAINLGVMYGHLDIIKLLAEKKDYPQALEFAKNSGRQDIVKYLNSLTKIDFF